MRVTNIGQVAIALGVIGLGLLGFIYHDFAMNWQPVPAWVRHREALAYLSALILLGSGVGLLLKRSAALSAAILAVFLFSWLILLELPRLVSGYASSYVWLGVGETLEMATGAWILCAVLSKESGANSPVLKNISNKSGRMALVLFALSLILVGQSHFVYVKETAAMVPAWLPRRIGIAYLTGAGHAAAGLALLFGVVPRLAITLEAVMMSLFVLLLHVPGVIAESASRLQWTMLCVALTITGGAWSVSRFVSKRM